MKTIKILAISLIAFTVVSCNKQGVTNKPLKTEIDSVSYALGLDMGIKVKANFSEVKSDFFMQGYNNGIDSTNLKLDTKDINRIVNSYFQKKQQEMAKKQLEKAEKKALVKFGDNKKAGETFLANNKTKKGVVTLESGVQYLVIKEGKGKTPKRNSRVKLHYHGMLIDGTVFDSSVDKKKPINHTANGFVKGFSEVLMLMKEGAKYKMFIPQELAYGIQQRGEKIKPFSALVFEVELLEVKE